jgi:hypothetical protein
MSALAADLLAVRLSGSEADSLLTPADSLVMDADSMVPDTLASAEGKKNKGVLEAPVNYSAEDSFTISISDQRTYLYRTATVKYQNINLDANFIEFDLGNHTVMANGMNDTAGIIQGKPVFKQGSDTYDADTIRYNFHTRKGMIKNIITQQGEGYLHSSRTKRLENGEIHINKGKYTTCDDPHPHFYIRLSKAIAIPKDKLVSGPAYMVLEDIPLPLALPFGFFPNTTNRSSGLIIPTYGEEQRLGFYLREGGWYFALNEYFDLTLLGSVYSRGSWGVKAASEYIVRYKFRGSFNADYAREQVKDDPNFTPKTNFKIMWTHSQDPKANPTRSFRASVNFSTLSFDRTQSYNVNEYVTNTKSSSISYSKNWPGSPFNFSANLQHSQNSNTRSINLSLPTMEFNMNRVYPFRGKSSDGKYNWLENIQVQYKANLENRVNAKDTTLFTRETLKNMSNGFKHNIPISLANIKVLKFVNIVPSVSYNGMLYTKYIQKRNMYFDTSLYMPYIKTDTIHKITYAHSMAASVGISANPKFYGMFQSTNPNSYVAVVRHVMSPSVSFSYTPDMSNLMPDYYRKVAKVGSLSEKFEEDEYSVYEKELYGTPSIRGRSGSVSLRLNNTLEMKVRAKSDTTGELKKVSILDNLNFNSSYNPFADKYKWSDMTMSGATRLFEKKLDLQFGATFSPYALDSNGRKTDIYLIRDAGRLFRTTQARLTVRFNLQSAAGDKKEKEENTEMNHETTRDMLDESQGSYGDYVDFDIPWRLSIDYSWVYSKSGLTPSYTNTIRVSGDISLTPKWKISGNTGYDFVTKELILTNFNIHRDLHCWEMRFSMVPFGQRRSYSFTISAKASMLRDVKYDKSRSWRDNF